MAIRPPNLNPALLTAQLELACVTVSDVPFATRGITLNADQIKTMIVLDLSMDLWNQNHK
jgi:hypothetical protein